MWNLKYNINEAIYKTETGTQRTDVWLLRWGMADGWGGNLGLADANCYTQDGKTTRSCSIAQGTIFNIL